jgi:hypothetical protein
MTSLSARDVLRLVDDDVSLALGLLLGIAQVCAHHDPEYNPRSVQNMRMLMV